MKISHFRHPEKLQSKVSAMFDVKLSLLIEAIGLRIIISRQKLRLFRFLPVIEDIGHFAGTRYVVKLVRLVDCFNSSTSLMVNRDSCV